MKELNENKVALTFGLFIGGWHLIWSVLVISGIAQMLLDFVFWAHMIANPYKVTGFTLMQSLTLIVMTFIFGYIGGYIFAKVWNTAHK